MSKAGIEQLLYLMDEAFDAQGPHGEHSLLVNLRSLHDDDWQWLPPGGGRSIFDIVRHAGECKYVYDNHAFGDATMRWDQPGTVPTVGPDEEPTAIIDWLREGHKRWRQSVAALDDDELLRPRKVNWGELKDTRWIIAVMIEHDLYHAGEINHIRALRQGNDRWAHEMST